MLNKNWWQKLSEKQTYALLVKIQPVCQLCGSDYRLHCHHRIYRSFGGKSVITNLIRLCQDCHEGVNGVHSNLYKDKEVKNRVTHPKTGANILVCNCLPIKMLSEIEIRDRLAIGDIYFPEIKPKRRFSFFTNL